METSKNKWKVYKFGGTSLKDASCFKRVIEIVNESRKDDTSTNLGIIVSAMSGMTDNLLNLTNQSEGDCISILEEINARYSCIAKNLVDTNNYNKLKRQCDEDVKDIQNLLYSRQDDDYSQQQNVISGYGEIWSARLLSICLEEALGKEKVGNWVDARKLLIIRHSVTGPIVQWKQTKKNFNKLFSDLKEIYVITGFIASDEKGVQTTLGRNGSDHSASIFSSLCNSCDLTIWSDVDGVMSADPNVVPNAKLIESLSYNEAMELAYFGAQVIHPKTFLPAMENKIPIIIRNTFSTDTLGTKITSDVKSKDTVKGISVIDDVALINIEGTGLIGVPGTADRLFSSLKQAEISVILISQASSEHSICIAIPQDSAKQAKEVISETFSEELGEGLVRNIDITSNQSILAVIGDNMAGSPGIAANFFGMLGAAKINVRAIAQGSSERNISAVINSSDSVKALRSVHSGFFQQEKIISIGIIGTGVVGSHLIKQLKDRIDWIKGNKGIDLKVRAIGKSNSMIIDDDFLPLDNWYEDLKQSSLSFDINKFIKHVGNDQSYPVIIDCTASIEISSQYTTILEKGIHIITPNKKAFSSDLSFYKELKESSLKGNSKFLYETTVGAALPVISTLKNLVDTGDQIISINGILSGTLAYLFNVYDGTMPFSLIVRKAKENGYTEPDPRDDLSGMDVGRKLTILAREVGHDLSIEDLEIEDLVADDLKNIEVSDFLDKLGKYDKKIEDRFNRAKEAGQVLRYIACLDENGKGTVGLKEISIDHAFSKIELTDNIIQIKSHRYSDNPLIIRGPGAGPSVTAGGIFADLLLLVDELH